MFVKVRDLAHDEELYVNTDKIFVISEALNGNWWIAFTENFAFGKGVAISSEDKEKIVKGGNDASTKKVNKVNTGKGKTV